MSISILQLAKFLDTPYLKAAGYLDKLAGEKEFLRIGPGNDGHLSFSETTSVANAKVPKDLKKPILRLYEMMRGSDPNGVIPLGIPDYFIHRTQENNWIVPERAEHEVVSKVGLTISVVAENEYRFGVGLYGHETSLHFKIKTKPNAIVTFAKRTWSEYYGDSVQVQMFKADSHGNVELPVIHKWFPQPSELAQFLTAGLTRGAPENFPGCYDIVVRDPHTLEEISHAVIQSPCTPASVDNRRMYELDPAVFDRKLANGEVHIVVDDQGIHGLLPYNR